MPWIDGIPGSCSKHPQPHPHLAATPLPWLCRKGLRLGPRGKNSESARLRRRRCRVSPTGISVCSHWTDVQVKGTSLPRALHCWDRSLHDNHKAGKAPLKGCPVHLVDSCPWPHCNPSCPTIRDQFTGQEMNVAQFLMHMGFDVQTVAQQQGLEPSKLLGMLSSGH